MPSPSTEPVPPSNYSDFKKLVKEYFSRVLGADYDISSDFDATMRTMDSVENKQFTDLFKQEIGKLSRELPRRISDAGMTMENFKESERYWAVSFSDNIIEFDLQRPVASCQSRPARKPPHPSAQPRQ